MLSRPYCKYFNDECYAPFCSVFPHSKSNKCPHIMASDEELDRIDDNSCSITQEEIDEWNKGEKND